MLAAPRDGDLGARPPRHPAVAVLPRRRWYRGVPGTVRSTEQSGHDAVVAFSVDQIDEENRSGWSVNVIGLSTFDYRVIGVLNDCGEPAAGQVVHLEPKVVTGQRLTLCPFNTSRGSARLLG